MKEHIILPAWDVLTRFHSLKKFNFIPSMLGTAWLFIILFYQLTITYIQVFHKKDEFFNAMETFIHKDYSMEVMILLGFIFVFYIFISPVAEGGIIRMIDSYKKTQGKNPRRSLQGLFDGFSHFLPLFELQNMIGIFKPLAIITFYILLLRLFGTVYLIPISIAMGIYLLLAFFLNMCFSYAKFFIIFEHKSAFQSIGASTTMAVNNIGITMRLYYTMILMYLRTLITAVLFLLLPFMFSSAIAYFSAKNPMLWLVLTVFVVISVLFFVVITHLSSSLEIFIEATWYEAYNYNKKQDAESGVSHDTHHQNQSTSHNEHGHH